MGHIRAEGGFFAGATGFLTRYAEVHTALHPLPSPHIESRTTPEGIGYRLLSSENELSDAKRILILFDPGFGGTPATYEPLLRKLMGKIEAGGGLNRGGEVYSPHIAIVHHLRDAWIARDDIGGVPDDSITQRAIESLSVLEDYIAQSEERVADVVLAGHSLGGPTSIRLASILNKNKVALGLEDLKNISLLPYAPGGFRDDEHFPRAYVELLHGIFVMTPRDVSDARREQFGHLSRIGRIRAGLGQTILERQQAIELLKYLGWDKSPHKIKRSLKEGWDMTGTDLLAEVAMLVSEGVSLPLIITQDDDGLFGTAEVIKTLSKPKSHYHGRKRDAAKALLPALRAGSESDGWQSALLNSSAVGLLGWLSLRDRGERDPDTISGIMALQDKVVGMPGGHSYGAFVPSGEDLFVGLLLEALNQ